MAKLVAELGQRMVSIEAALHPGGGGTQSQASQESPTSDTDASARSEQMPNLSELHKTCQQLERIMGASSPAVCSLKAELAQLRSLRAKEKPLDRAALDAQTKLKAKEKHRANAATRLEAAKLQVTEAQRLQDEATQALAEAEREVQTAKVMVLNFRQQQCAAIFEPTADSKDPGEAAIHMLRERLGVAGSSDELFKPVLDALRVKQAAEQAEALSSVNSTDMDDEDSRPPRHESGERPISEAAQPQQQQPPVHSSSTGTAEPVVATPITPEEAKAYEAFTGKDVFTGAKLQEMFEGSGSSWDKAATQLNDLFIASAKRARLELSGS